MIFIVQKFYYNTRILLWFLHFSNSICKFVPDLVLLLICSFQNCEISSFFIFWSPLIFFSAAKPAFCWLILENIFYNIFLGSFHLEERNTFLIPSNQSHYQSFLHCKIYVFGTVAAYLVIISVESNMFCVGAILL